MLRALHGRSTLELEDVIAKSAKSSRSWLVWVAGGAGLGVAVVAIAAVVYLTVFTVSLSVDGKSVRLPAGSTVATLYAKGIVDRKPGNLVSAKNHHVLRLGAGDPPRVSASGVILLASSPLRSSAVLVSSNGADVVEPTHVTTVAIAPPTRYEGTGPIETVIQTGTPGVQEIKVGDISNQVVSKKQKVAPTAKIVARQEPTKGAKIVALTFDDGPWPGSTRAILKILQANGIKATFFEIGQQAKGMPDLSRDVADAGMELGNHSETHPLNLGRLSAAGVSDEITMAQYSISKASGQTPTVFRPPGGNTTPAMYPVLAKLKLRWVQWDIDTDDWQKPPAATIVSRVVRNVRPGAVVLMHDGGGNRSHTVAALPQIIAQLKAMGYSFVTISQLSTLPHTMG
ncbi:MAG: polysaccharide deacetylase family protein [Coriobacteriia bacterium]|nr:polysaccharide deacetylase family protein [Coriobacteriia bacterium]